jgi:large subunit ribosomal protein L23
MNVFDIVKTVRITEKGTLQAEKFNQYTVVADRRANAVAIKKAVEQLFNVKVVRVNTQNVRGKARRQNTKAAGKTSDWKKAIITLKKGDKIELQ